MVNYAPGKLEAVAYKKGKKITAFVQTTGQPYKIVVTPSRTSILADSKDAAVFNITVVDKSGMEVPDAGNLLHFSVSGPAKIVGVGNGDPSSHEPDQYPGAGWQRKLFNGKCQVILQSADPHSPVQPEKGKEGEIKLVVNGEGLPPASATIGARSAL